MHTMAGPWDSQPLLFVEQRPDDRKKNRVALNASVVKSHIAKSYRFPRIEVSRPSSRHGGSVLVQSGPSGYVERKQASRQRKRPLDHDSSLQPCPRPYLVPPPRESPPIFPNRFKDRQTDRSLVFEYYVREWWPHSRQLGVSSAIFGFTPMLASDNLVVDRMVSSALQYPSTLSIEAILAASACRMQMFRGQPFSDPHLCEVLHLQAIRSLRVRLDVNSPVDEQLVLDLSRLMYAEIFTKSGPPADVLWNICKEVIVKLGGLGALSPLTAVATLSTDLFVANANLTTPVLNVYQNPRLLGLHDTDGLDPIELELLLRQRIAALDPRSRAIVELTHSFGMSFPSLWNLPEIRRTLHMLPKNRARFAKNLRSPLRPVSSSSSPANNNKSGDAIVPAQVYAADCEALQMKMYAFNTYLALSSITCETFPNQTVAAAPEWAEAALSSIWVRIDTINSLLAGTDWELRPDHLIWVCAMGLCASKSSIDRAAYDRILKQTCRRLEIKDGTELLAELSLLLPLDHVPGYVQGLLASATSLAVDYLVVAI